METRRYAEYNLSRLILGTAQFGMAYGVANRTGQPAHENVLAIVAAAIEAGVNCFDTAAVYGASEDVLGRVLHELGAVERVVVITKVRPLTPLETGDAALAAKVIEQSVSESRRRLGLDCLPVVLFHREEDAAHLNVLEMLKARGWLRHAGVSCAGRPGPAAAFVADGHTSAVQLPGNVLDQRHQRSGIFRDAASRGVAVFIRSVYLQGLLVMPEDMIPEPLREVVPVRRRLAEIAGQGGMTLAECALRYMLAQDGVTGVLTGVETVAQIRENVALFNRGPLGSDMLAALNAAVPALSEFLITPPMWPPLSAPADRTGKTR